MRACVHQLFLVLSWPVDTLHWRLCVWRQRTEPVLFRPVTAANLTDSCALSTSPSPFLSTEELQGVTLRPSPWPRPPQPDESRGSDCLALWPCRAIQKYPHPPLQWDCTVQSWPFYPSLPSSPSPLIAPSLSPPTCVWSRQLCSQSPAWFFFFLSFLS